MIYKQAPVFCVVADVGTGIILLPNLEAELLSRSEEKGPIPACARDK